MSQVERSDDEVDLSDLQKADAPSAKKSRKSVSTPPAPPKKKAAAPVSPAAPDQEASLVKLTAETQTIDAVNQEAPAAPKPIPEAVQPEPVDFEAAQPFPKTSSLESEKQDAIASDKNTKMLLPVLVVALVIVGLISLVALKRIGDSSEKIKGLEAAAKSYVTADELKVVKGETEKITTLQANIAVLGAQIDSLQVTVKQLVDEASKQKKPPVRRRTYRKR